MNNYPNPFNSSTVIPYRLKEEGYVKLYVYDIKGELVRTLINEYQSAGYYEVKFSPTSEERKSGEFGEGWGNLSDPDKTWAAEIMQPAFSLDDPDASQGLGDWIYVNGVGPTQFAEYIAAYISEVDNQKYQYDGTSGKTEKK